MKLYRFERSTNVERVALALAYKGLELESIWVDPNDRTPVRETSGQDLVPVLVDGERVLFESMNIVRYLEHEYPDPPLYPRDAARRAELEVFVEWFDRVWKGPPNEIAAELERPHPDQATVERLARRMADWLDLFEGLLTGREHLFGQEFTAAVCAAFPFVKYAHFGVERGDEEVFHHILADYQPLGGTHPKVEAWILRVDKRPRA